MTSKTFSKTTKLLPAAPRNKRLRAAGAVAAASSQTSAAAGDWLPRSEFYELFERVTLAEPTETEEGEYAIRAKHSLYSEGSISALGLGGDDDGGDTDPTPGGGVGQEELDALRTELEQVKADAKLTTETLVGYIMTMAQSLDNLEAKLAAARSELEQSMKGYLPLSGGTLTGTLTVEGDLTTQSDNYLCGNTEIDNLLVYDGITTDGNIAARGNITALQQ